MNMLTQWVGHEHRLDEVGRAVRSHVQSLRPAAVGAMLVTCSDESENECAEAFQQTIVSDLLPPLKFARKAPFRSATMGGRYEWGSALIAEDHFATEAARHADMVLVIKIQSHVSLDDRQGEPVFGRMSRYERDSTYCGALAFLVDGRRGPVFLEELRESFSSEGIDRVAALNDTSSVPRERRNLYAAVVNARLQARKALLDIQDRPPSSPTCFVIVPSVTLNRRGHDTEIVVGVYEADRRTAKPVYTYQGLGDDPTAYRFELVNRKIRVTDDGAETIRAARDHRELIAEVAREHPGAAMAGHPKLQELVRWARGQAEGNEPAKQVLQAMLLVLGEVAPVPVALLLFSSGVAGMYQVFRAHRLVTEPGDKDAAELIVDQVRQSLDTMSPEEAEHVLDRLLTFLSTEKEGEE